MTKVNVNIVYDFLKREKISNIEFCKRCNISYNTLKKLLSGEANFKLSIVYKSLMYLKVGSNDLFEIK